VEQLDDFLDIIINNESFKEKLIFQNTKFQRNGLIYEQILQKLKARCVERNEEFNFSVNQLRSKFKKCVAECKKIALTIKTATGVQNFIRERGYGATFNHLYALVKTRDSCNPEKAVEPSAPSVANSELSDVTEAFEDNGNGSFGEKKEEKQFVPVRKRRRKNKDDTVSEAIQLMRELIENDPTRDMIKLMREDMEKSRQHEMKLMQMLLGNGNLQPTSVEQQYPPPFIEHSSPNENVGYSLPFPPTMPASHHSYFPQDLFSQQGYQFHPVPTSAAVSLLPPATSSKSSKCSPSTDSSISVSPVYHSM
jgi:hypothetical protein